jgi:hypothetical protein
MFIGCGQMAVMPVCFPPSCTRTVTDPGSDPHIYRILSGQNGSPGWTAHLASGITTREFHAFIGYAVDIRTFIIGRSFIAQIAPTQVVCQYENDIWLPVFGGASKKDEHGQDEDISNFHKVSLYMINELFNSYCW